MTNEILDIVGAVFVLIGAFLTLTAAIGMVRLPDVLTRMHAATKPQTLGLFCSMIGVAVYLRQAPLTGLLILAIVLQMLTAPIAAHMIGRTAYRTNQIRRDLLEVDELGDDLATAGFTLATAPESPDTADDSSDVHPADDDPADEDVDVAPSASTQPPRDN